MFIRITISHTCYTLYTFLFKLWINCKKKSTVRSVDTMLIWVQRCAYSFFIWLFINWWLYSWSNGSVYKYIDTFTTQTTTQGFSLHGLSRQLPSRVIGNYSFLCSWTSMLEVKKKPLKICCFTQDVVCSTLKFWDFMFYL